MPNYTQQEQQEELANHFRIARLLIIPDAKNSMDTLIIIHLAFGKELLQEDPDPITALYPLDVFPNYQEHQVIKCTLGQLQQGLSGVMSAEELEEHFGLLLTNWFAFSNFIQDSLLDYKQRGLPLATFPQKASRPVQA